MRCIGGTVVSGSRCVGILGALLIAMVLFGCAGPAVQPVAPSQTPSPVAGQVLGRSDRFVIYDPGPNDTLASLALRFLGGVDRHWLIADFNGIDHVETGLPLVIPLAPINPVGVRANEYQTVPILCYHRFGSGKGRMIVSPAQFTAQLDWLQRNDYRVIPLQQLADYLQGKAVIPKRAVVITIDDGHESSYQYAVPILRRFGYPATFFVYTDYIGSGSAITWAQLKEMSTSGLFEIGAHSKTHRNLAVRDDGETDAHYRKNLDTEVRVPIDVLQRHLDLPVNLYAFPYGDANELVLEMVAKENVQLAATVTPGPNAFFAQPLLLRRTMIFGEYDLETFKSKVQVSRRLNEP